VSSGNRGWSSPRRRSVVSPSGALMSVLRGVWSCYATLSASGGMRGTAAPPDEALPPPSPAVLPSSGGAARKREQGERPSPVLGSRGAPSLGRALRRRDVRGVIGGFDPLMGCIQPVACRAQVLGMSVSFVLHHLHAVPDACQLGEQDLPGERWGGPGVRRFRFPPAARASCCCPDIRG
jgi:hypothetical protein